MTIYGLDQRLNMLLTLLGIGFMSATDNNTSLIKVLLLTVYWWEQTLTRTDIMDIELFVMLW